jgi:hypothetical protein
VGSSHHDGELWVDARSSLTLLRISVHTSVVKVLPEFQKLPVKVKKVKLSRYMP